MWHLSEVRHLWGWIVRKRAQDLAAYVEPSCRPDEELLGFVTAVSAELETALTKPDLAEQVWTWGPRKDVGFVRRRQTREAVVHTVDVEHSGRRPRVTRPAVERHVGRDRADVAQHLR